MPSVPPSTPVKQPRTQKGGWRNKILTVLRISNRPAVNVYRGFGTATQLTIQGHVLRLGPLPRTKYRRNFWLNTFAVLRLFVVRPYPNAVVRIHGTTTLIKTDGDGFFRVEWTPDIPLSPGWHPVQVDLVGDPNGSQQTLASGTGEVHVPYPTQYGFISDIDDTFLISHSATKFKRLLVLLTENARSRMPFEGVVTHYQALSRAKTHADAPNPFFYVSSSEWNLYEYILEFSRQHQLPTGVLMLSQLKRFRQLWQTGQNKHLTKLDRIAWILAAFPSHTFVLLGDDTQADPIIYATVVGHHPTQIRCVYLRQVGSTPKPDVQAIVATIEAAGVPCCYFNHSAVAMAHSRQLGLI
ncbi:MAG: DUF2183 domain-containing protein [Bacteroidetes bacterium]|nr:DUF2183 domain-containing protein [Fibrella sp.]